MVTPTASEENINYILTCVNHTMKLLFLKFIYFSSFDGATPVHVAAAWGKKEELDMLLSRGGDPMIKDNEGQTALDYAKNENQEVYLKLKSYQGTMYPELEDVQKYTYELGVYTNNFLGLHLYS
jgi:Ankyrin repeat